MRAIEINNFKDQEQLQQLQENLEETLERTMPEHAKYWKEQLSEATDLDKTMPKVQKNRKRNGSQVNMEPRGEAL